MSDECPSCGGTVFKDGTCCCVPDKGHYFCGHCGAEVPDGEACACRGDSDTVSTDVLNPASFSPLPYEQGFHITLDNGWSLHATKTEPDTPEKIKIQAFMPQGFLILIFGREEWIVTCNDLAVILYQTSQSQKGLVLDEAAASQSFEAMLEGLMFGTAA